MRIATLVRTNCWYTRALFHCHCSSTLLPPPPPPLLILLCLDKDVVDGGQRAWGIYKNITISCHEASSVAKHCTAMPRLLLRSSTQYHHWRQTGSTAAVSMSSQPAMAATLCPAAFQLSRSLYEYVSISICQTQGHEADFMIPSRP